MNRFQSTTVVLAAVAALGVPAVASAAGSATNHDLAAARHATAQFLRTAAAGAAGYGAFLPDVPLHECIESLHGDGAMGVHWVNGALLDTTVDPAHPEVLVYEPTKNGRLRLVSLEYVVFAEPWAAEHGDAPPQVLGMDMAYVGTPNRYELPAFWQRHAWVWKGNPSGVFADHNPKVSCDHAG